MAQTFNIVAKTKIPINIIAQDESGAALNLQNATIGQLRWIYPDNSTTGSGTPTVQSSPLVKNGVTLAAAYCWAQYICSVTDFPVDGTYTAQANITNADTTTPASIPITIVAAKKI